MTSKKIMQLLSTSKVETGLSVSYVSLTITKDAARAAVYAFFGGDAFFVNTISVGSGLTKYDGVANKTKTVFLGYCSALQTFILRFTGIDVNKNFKNFVEKFLLNNPMEEIVEDVRLTSVESQMVCMPGPYSAPEDFINAIEKLRQVQQKSLPKLEVKEGTLYIGGKTGNNSIRIIALKSQTGNIQSLCLLSKAKGPVAEKIGNLFRLNPQAKFEDVLAFHILMTLNSIASTPFLELFKQDFVKMYAVGSILLQQNTEKQVFSPAGTYVSRSLKGIARKLYSDAHSAEVQELFLEWVRMLVVNQKFIYKGETLIKSLKALFDGKSVVPTESDKPVETKPLRKRPTRRAVEDKIVDEPPTNG